MTTEHLYAERERTWDEMSHHASVSAMLLMADDVEGARHRAADYTAARDLWVEFGQQLRDVRRAVTA